MDNMFSPKQSRILERVERALTQSFNTTCVASCPSGLREAIHYALFPGGARLRPQLCLAVAEACGDARPLLADQFAAAVEFLHCASIVHDDLPAFDDAPFRRGRASLHARFGEPTALLVGDALIVMAFDIMAREVDDDGSFQHLALATRTLAKAAGPSHGLVAGQAWELEGSVALREYHAAKTASLFQAATVLGALAGGAQDALTWDSVGRNLGEAYQIADDYRDVHGTSSSLGKPVGRDAVLKRPNMIEQIGAEKAVLLLSRRLEAATASVPACKGEARVRSWILDVLANPLLALQRSTRQDQALLRA